MSKKILTGVDFILKSNKNINKDKKMSIYFIRVSQSWLTLYHLQVSDHAATREWQDAQPDGNQRRQQLCSPSKAYADWNHSKHNATACTSYHSVEIAKSQYWFGKPQQSTADCAAITPLWMGDFAMVRATADDELCVMKKQHLLASIKIYKVYTSGEINSSDKEEWQVSDTATQNRHVLSNERFNC